MFIYFFYIQILKSQTIMKKVFLYAAVLVVIAGFSSCMKDYTCKCEYTEGGDKQTIDIPMDFKTKLLAETQCDTEESLFLTTYPDAKCELK